MIISQHRSGQVSGLFLRHLAASTTSLTTAVLQDATNNYMLPARAFVPFIAPARVVMCGLSSVMSAMTFCFFKDKTLKYTSDLLIDIARIHGLFHSFAGVVNFGGQHS